MKIKKFALLLCLALCACCCRQCLVIRRYTRQRSFSDRPYGFRTESEPESVQWFVWNKLWLSEWSGSLSDGYGMCRCCCTWCLLSVFGWKKRWPSLDSFQFGIHSFSCNRILFRPIYAMNNVCYLRVYKVYPNRSFFYFGRPVHYLTYHGAHSRRFTGIQAITVRIIPAVIIIRCIKVISTLVRSSENMTLSLLGRLRIPDIILLRHDLQLRQHPLIVLRHVRHIVRV